MSQPQAGGKAQSLRDIVLMKIGDTEELKPEEYSNLIFDDQKLAGHQLTTEDKAFLEEFNTLAALMLNNTGIKSLVNLPNLTTLERIELNDNRLGGAELKHLLQYENLKTIKFAGNQVKDFSDLEVLKPLKHLESLDLTENPICEKDGYVEKVYAMFAPSLNVLDSCDKDGNEVSSHGDDDDEDYDDEDDEDEEGAPQKGKNRYEGEGELDDEDEGDDEEYGEEEEYDDELDESESQAANKGDSNGKGGADSKR